MIHSVSSFHYLDATLPTSSRVEHLLSLMTLDEKIGQMTQLDITLINTTGKQCDVELDSKKARDIIRDYHIGSFLNGEAVAAEKWFTFMDELTRLSVEHSRLGIPILYGIDHMHGASYVKGSTIFPHNINLAASFNPENAHSTGEVTSIEAADLGHRWIFAPVLDLGQNPHWGRMYETYGEDPYLASCMGVAFVKGMQETSETYPFKVAATAKHFLGYSIPKSGWDRTPVSLPDQMMHEFHRPAFQSAIDAGLKTVMLNSGEVNGVPIHASKKYLTHLLRNQMGFKGVVVTDWADVEKLVTFHKVAENMKEATFMAIEAGIDMNMTPLDVTFIEDLKELVEEGRITTERIDESVRRILTLKFDLGLFEHPYPTNKRFPDRIGNPKYRHKAKVAAQESIVLLKNDTGVLPLEKPHHIIVAGLSGNSKRNLAGGWSLAWQGGNESDFPSCMPTVFTALKSQYPNANVTCLDLGELQAASQLTHADCIVYVAGEKPYSEFAGNLSDLTLDQVQRSEISYLETLKAHSILVLVEGRPRIITDVVDSVDAILWAGLPGFEGAEAIVDVMSGKVNPSGKLPFSYPMHTGHFVPYNHKSSDVYYYDPKIANAIIQNEHRTNLFEFGEGLSYTSFSYSNLKLSQSILNQNETVKAEITVTNNGDRAGLETVLWFLSDKVGRITRPVKALKHFQRIYLRPKEYQTLSFVITASHLSYPDENGNSILEKGAFEVLVGTQKASFRLI